MKKSVKILVGLVLILGFLSVTNVISPLDNPIDPFGNPGDPGNGGTPGFSGVGEIDESFSFLKDDCLSFGFELNINSHISISL